MQQKTGERAELVCLRDSQALSRDDDLSNNDMLLSGQDKQKSEQAEDSFQGDFSNWQGRQKRQPEWQPHEEASNDLDLRSSWGPSDQISGRADLGRARVSVYRDERNQEQVAEELAGVQPQVFMGTRCPGGECLQGPSSWKSVDDPRTSNEARIQQYQDQDSRKLRQSFRVSAEEAKRIFGAQPWISALSTSQQKARARHLLPSHSAIRTLPVRQAFSGRSQRRSELLSSPIELQLPTIRGPTNIRLHRSDLSKPQVSGLDGEEQNKTLADMSLKIGQRPVVGGAVDADGQTLPADETPLECKMRRYSFKASKTDENGNKCFGQVEASICYGGCDSGEIADWIFPHKKSVHKVCTHGRRVRRRVVLNECSSELVEPSTREYYFADAINCVCKKCTSLDTTCLGSLTPPYLANLEVAATSSELVVDADGGQQPVASISY